MVYYAPYITVCDSMMHYSNSVLRRAMLPEGPRWKHVEARAVGGPRGRYPSMLPVLETNR